MMTRGAGGSKGTRAQNQKKAQWKKGKGGPTYFICEEKHRMKDFPQWQSVMFLIKKNQGNAEPRPYNL